MRDNIDTCIYQIPCIPIPHQMIERQQDKWRTESRLKNINNVEYFGWNDLSVESGILGLLKKPEIIGQNFIQVCLCFFLHSTICTSAAEFVYVTPHTPALCPMFWGVVIILVFVNRFGSCSCEEVEIWRWRIATVTRGTTQQWEQGSGIWGNN